MTEIYRLTPIHHWHRLHGAIFILEAGWKRVESYGNAEQEVSLVRATVGICDVTPLTKIDCQGRGVVSFLARLLVQAAVPEPGRHSRAFLSGGNAGEIQIARLTAERALVFAAPAARESLMTRFAATVPASECVHVTDLTSGFGVIRLVGPCSTDVLKAICALRLDDKGLAPGRCAQAPVARVPAVVIREDIAIHPMSFLVLVSRDYSEYVWTSLMAAGKRHQITHFGLAAAVRLARGDH